MRPEESRRSPRGSLNSEDVLAARQTHDGGIPAPGIARQLGVSKATVYRALFLGALVS
ncbi:helix-turn-helix domain-containing protein [Geodermatophilus sp. SYSU D00708]